MSEFREDVESKGSSSQDKGPHTVTAEVELSAHERIVIEDGLRRGLLGRHISLISLASVIGASAFYGFGYALFLSGPLGALLGFSIVGMLRSLMVPVPVPMPI